MLSLSSPPTPPVATRISVVLCICWLSQALRFTSSLPTLPGADTRSRQDDIVVVEEAAYYTDFGIDSTTTLFTSNSAVVTNSEKGFDRQQHDGNESMVGSSVSASDDLIFLTDKPPTHLQRQQQQEQQLQQLKQQQYQRTNEHRDYNPDIYGIDLLTVIEDLSSSFSSSCSSSCETRGGDADADPDTDINDREDETVPREIELQTDDLSPPSSRRLVIDMHDFVALIPANEVKTIVANYYRNDAEVQRAYTYLSSPNFAVLKQNILTVPEMSEFLRYLNASGLDVVEFFHTLTNLTTESKTPTTTEQDALIILSDSSISDNKHFNELKESAVEENGTTTTTKIPTPSNALTIPTQQNALLSLPTQNTKTLKTTLKPIKLPTTSSPSPPQIQTTTTKISLSRPTETTSESLNGLHGLVDSILDVLPQDQILTTFFDKLETNEQFSKLVDNVGSPAFANILQNMKNSPALRNLIFALHNNGIYITRIADSLKAYFFLGTF